MLKTLILIFSLESGLIPGHDVSLYIVPEHQELINVSITNYVDMEFGLEAFKYFKFSGGMTSYAWPNKNRLEMYPFRMDYSLGASFHYKAFELGYGHGCFHTVIPNLDRSPLPKLDSGNDRFYINITMRKNLFD